MTSSQQTILGTDPNADPNDMTAQYNTKLSTEDEAKFQQWVAQTGRDGDLRDYDLRGAWKSDAQQASNGHLPDTWKKPNHPTFSDESQYSTKDSPGGKWKEEKGGRWSFTPSAVNLRNLGVAGLKQYFQQSEPDSDLILPKEAGMFPTEYQQEAKR